MSDTVIKVENLSKCYQIGHQIQQGYTTLRDVWETKAKLVGKRLIHPFKSSEGGPSVADETEEFWALKDVSFEVKRGDRIGIIGRNGAGKSTLLKVLSRITEPTKGRIEIEGRLASLLEVGTGFHPELTGRENIYLNGAILGMSKSEIKRNFDEIVAFAEIEKFLDTPVKRYSSGMYVRLAFAVAAHLEPEILIVDEVLAVGDAQFQKKCLGKMQEVGDEGRTLLFVSHNMAAVEGLCHKGIVLNQGACVFCGASGESIEIYDKLAKKMMVTDIKHRTDRVGNQKAKCKAIKILNRDGEETNVIEMGASFTIELVIEGEFSSAIVGVLVGNAYREQMIRGYTYESYDGVIDIKGDKVIRCKFKNFPMMHGNYNIHVWVGRKNEVADYVQNASELIISPRDVFGTGRILDPHGGVAFSCVDWEIEDINEITEDL